MSNPLIQSLHLGRFGKISNSPTKRGIFEELTLLLNTVPVGMEIFLNHFHLGWKHERNVDGLIIFSAFPFRQNSSIVELSKILSNNGLDDTLSNKSLGPNEIRKVLSEYLLNLSPVKPRDHYSSGRVPKKARDQIYNRYISHKNARNNQIAIKTIDLFPNINRLTIKMSMAWQ